MTSARPVLVDSATVRYICSINTLHKNLWMIYFRFSTTGERKREREDARLAASLERRRQRQTSINDSPILWANNKAGPVTVSLLSQQTPFFVSFTLKIKKKEQQKTFFDQKSSGCQKGGEGKHSSFFTLPTLSAFELSDDAKGQRPRTFCKTKVQCHRDSPSPWNSWQSDWLTGLSS